MAVMYPRTLFEPDLKSEAEGKVFEALEAQLDDEWEVFHSMGWVVRDKKKGSDDGEIDFVLAHPEHGILCLEVKGGGIECQHGEWYGIHDGKRERIRGPVPAGARPLPRPEPQARRHACERRRQALDRSTAVAFPDITVHELVLAPDAPPELDRRPQRDRDDRRVDRAGARLPPRRREKRPAGPGADGDEDAPRAAGPRGPDRGPDGGGVPRRGGGADHPHPRAGAAPAPLRRDPRMVVTGCAGSGKTMLAVEQAKRLAAKGKDVLFVCFNKRAPRPPAQDARRPRASTSTPSTASARALAKQAGLALPTDGRASPARASSSEELPRRCSSAIEELGPQYDALFVDEAQDLEHDWLDALMTTLRDPDDGARLAVHGRQPARLRERSSRCPTSSAPSTSTSTAATRRRSTARCMKKYEGEVEPEAIGPRAARSSCIHTDDQAGDGPRGPRAPLREGGGSAPGHRRPQLPRHRQVRSRARPAAATTPSSTSRGRSATTSASARSAASRASSHRS